MPTEIEDAEFQVGYLAGLVDGEGYVVMHYDNQSGRTYPGLRIYGTSKSIIDTASRILNSNSFPRRDKGKVVGWLASVQGKKAIEGLLKINLT